MNEWNTKKNLSKKAYTLTSLFQSQKYSKGKVVLKVIQPSQQRPLVSGKVINEAKASG